MTGIDAAGTAEMEINEVGRGVESPSSAVS